MLSIIIPTLNEEKVLSSTINSLRELKDLDYEIIISDGGSSDDTLTIARSLADKVITTDAGHRQTIAEGRNAGAAIASGEYLAFLDADVQIKNPKHFFTGALDLFNEKKDLVALTVFIKVFPQHATLADKFFFSVVNLQMRVMNNFFHIGAAGGEFQMIKTESFKKVGGYNSSLTVAEDNDLFARLSKIGKTYVAAGLSVYHTSRRAHEIGWAKLLLLWWINFFYYKFYKTSFSKEWEVVR